MILSPQYRGVGVFAEIAHFMTVVSKILNNFRLWGGRAVVTESGIDLYIDDVSKKPDADITDTTQKTIERATEGPQDGSHGIYGAKDLLYAAREKVPVLGIPQETPDAANPKAIHWEWICTLEADAKLDTGGNFQAVTDGVWYPPDYADANKAGRLYLNVLTGTILNGRLNIDSDSSTAEIRAADSTGDLLKDLIDWIVDGIIVTGIGHDDDLTGVPGSTAHSNYWILNGSHTASETHNGNIAGSCAVDGIWGDANTVQAIDISDADLFMLMGGAWEIVEGDLTISEASGSTKGSLTVEGGIEITGTDAARNIVSIQGDKVLASRITGWTFPGGGSKSAFTAVYTAPTVSATYDDAEIQDMADMIEDLSLALAELLDNFGLGGHGSIGPTPS